MLANEPNDFLTAGNGNDFLNGGAGNDRLDGGAGNDTFLYTVGDGADTVTVNEPAAGAFPTAVSVNSGGGDDTVQQMARLVGQQRTASEEVGTYGVFVRNLVFYAGVKTTDIINDDQARNFLLQSNRSLMVATAESIDRLERDGLKVGVNWSGTRALGYDVEPSNVGLEITHARNADL